MAQSLRDIGAALGREVEGNADLMIRRPAEPGQAGEDDLALAMSPAYADALRQTKARAAIVWEGCDWSELGLEAAISVERARLAMSQLTQALDTGLAFAGVHASAVIDPSVHLGEGVHIGAFVTIGANARIGDGAWIDGQVSIGEDAAVGEGALIHAGVRIGRRVTLGRNVILQPNAVIGGDGFSFVTAGPSNEERAFRAAGRKPLDPPEDAIRHRIHSLGGVLIGDDVEVGANTAIDAGTIRPTRIGRGTKLDNLVQIGHNVVIGEDCVICGQVGIAGSSQIGDRSVLGGSSAVKDNIGIGKDVVVGGRAVVYENVPDGSFLMGQPALPVTEYRAQQKAIKRLTVSKGDQSA